MARLASAALSHFSRRCREQRVTGIIVFVLTGISVFLAPILKVKHSPFPILWMFGGSAKKKLDFPPNLGPRSCCFPQGKRCVLSVSAVHPHASAVRSLSVHGRRVAEWHPGMFSSSSFSSSLMAVKGSYARAKRGIFTPKFAGIQYFQQIFQTL